MASFVKNPRHLSRTLYSTFSSLPKPSTTLSSQLAKSSIFAESNLDNLAELFSQQSVEFARFRPILDLSVQKLARSNRHDLVLPLIEAQKNSPEIASLLKSEGFWIRLIMLYSKSGMVDEAMEIFDQMEEYECKLTEKSLCAILTVFYDNKQFDKVHELFTTLPMKIGVNPSVKMHTLVLKAFCKEKKVESAKLWIQNMKNEYNIEPDIDSYNELLGVYFKNGNVSEFDAIVNEISRKCLEFNLTAYNHRISMYCKNKECIQAKKLLYEMISRGQNPNPTSYNSIIHGLCKLGDLQSAKKVLDSMLTDGYVSPNSFTFTILMGHMVKEGKFVSALEICKEIIARKWVPPFDTMSGLVNGLVKMSKAEEAKEVIENMKKRLKGPALDSWGKIETGLALEKSTQMDEV